MHSSSLVCNRLMATWKLDLNIALAAMEVLSGLPRVSLQTAHPLMCKRTVNWICAFHHTFLIHLEPENNCNVFDVVAGEFIVYQSSRPAMHHSKDLHSMIVAAFHCLCTWLVSHEYLLRGRECLHCVLEVVELGISGSKSQVCACVCLCCK